LLDDKNFPICVLEAKSEEKDPLIGKEQARRYANSQNVRFIILQMVTFTTFGIKNLVIRQEYQPFQPLKA